VLTVELGVTGWAKVLGEHHCEESAGLFDEVAIFLRLTLSVRLLFDGAREGSKGRYTAGGIRDETLFCSEILCRMDERTAAGVEVIDPTVHLRSA